MPADQNWARWIFASLATYLKQVAVDNRLAVMVEGLDERSTEFMHASDRVEIRITGPFIREVSHDYWRLNVDANVLVTSRFDGPDAKTRYTFTQIAGIFQAAMEAAIAVYRYGNQPGDDETLVGCLSPLAGRHDAVKVFHFGQVNSASGLRQSMVDAKYVMDLTNNQIT
jgi:hypothetical protein